MLWSSNKTKLPKHLLATLNDSALRNAIKNRVEEEKRKKESKIDRDLEKLKEVVKHHPELLKLINIDENKRVIFPKVGKEPVKPIIKLSKEEELKGLRKQINDYIISENEKQDKKEAIEAVEAYKNKEREEAIALLDEILSGGKKKKNNK